MPKETNRQKVILAVDDIAENLELLARNLQRAGHKVLLATSGPQAIEIASAKIPDLVLMDIQMPEMTGIEACKEIKQNPITADIPIIFLTAKTEQDSIVEAFAAGAVDYILKPFYNEELYARLRTHLSLKELRAELVEKNRELEGYITMVDTHIAISKTDADGIVTYISKALCDMSGYEKDELIGQKHCCFKSGCTSDELYKDLWNTIKGGKKWRGEILDRKKSGELFWVDTTITPQLSKEGSIEGYMAIWHDITDRKKLQEQGGR